MKIWIALLMLWCSDVAMAKLLILHATWGADAVQLDVTTRLQTSIAGNILNVKAESSAFGKDPIFGKTKTLAIRYESEKGEFTVDVPEGSSLILNPQSAVGKAKIVTQPNLHPSAIPLITPPAISSSIPETLHVSSPKVIAPRTFEVLIVGGKELHNVRVVVVVPSGLRVLHDDGAAFVNFEELPKTLQKEFNFDLDSARDDRERQW